MKKIKWKIYISIVTIAIAIYFLYPSIIYYTSPGGVEKYERKKINFGLDLKGGVYVVLEVDESKLPKDVTIDDAVERAIEIIRNRVDQYGVTEPLIVRQGEKWINVQLPGITDRKLAMELIGKTALLEFRLVDETDSIGRITAKIHELGLSRKEGITHKEVLSLVPTGYVILPSRTEGDFLVVKATPELTGAHLTDARVQIGGEFGLPFVQIRFDREGAKKFADVTGANIDRNLAIVLDNVVQSAPVIREKIPGGEAVIEGNFTMDEARFLATVLRAGALPAPVNIIEERTVGPTLGSDYIRQGFYGLVTAFIAIVIFMLVYYKLSGVIAGITLLFNIFFLFATLAGFRATLTLSGMAGIILTIGMAVDANIIILERIKEELKSGKTLMVSIDTGYSRAFKTILDANLTTLLAVAFLFQFGVGPIRGFALTLSIGLIINMFTAVFMAKLIYEILLLKKINPTLLFRI